MREQKLNITVELRDLQEGTDYKIKMVICFWG